MRILIVEDEPANRLLIEGCLAGIHQTDSAENGQVGLDLFRDAHRNRTPYDLILLDIEMPVMNGQETLKSMRELECELALPPGNEVKVLMISGHSDQKNVCQAFFKGNASGFLVKPVSRDNLLATIDELGLK